MELERLIKAVAGVLDLDPATITADSKFVDDLGADSLDVLEIVMGIEEEFGIQVPTDEAQLQLVMLTKKLRKNLKNKP